MERVTRAHGPDAPLALPRRAVRALPQAAVEHQEAVRRAGPAADSFERAFRYLMDVKPPAMRVTMLVVA